MSWLSPYKQIWSFHYKGELSESRIARPFKKLEQMLGRDRTIGAFRKYCETTPVRFASVVRFAEKAGSFAPRQHAPIAPSKPDDASYYKSRCELIDDCKTEDEAWEIICNTNEMFAPEVLAYAVKKGKHHGRT